MKGVRLSGRAQQSQVSPAQCTRSISRPMLFDQRSAYSSAIIFSVQHKPNRGSLVVSKGLLSTTSSNPAFSMGKISDSVSQSPRSEGIMTSDGAAQKACLMLVVTVMGAGITWTQIFSGNYAAATAALGVSKVAGFVALAAALGTMFKPHLSPYTGLLFCAAKGLALGGASAMAEMMYPGIALNAMMLTFGTAATLLIGFQARILSVSDNFRNGVGMVTGGYFFMMIGSMLLSMVGVRVPGLLSAGPLAIGISLVASALAASNLLLDFDMIRTAAYQKMPKWFEWYGAFSLMVTLVWFYTEVLRLLMAFGKGGSSDD